jgi:superoxide dismutase, Cu-Zn family
MDGEIFAAESPSAARKDARMKGATISTISIALMSVAAGSGAQSTDKSVRERLASAVSPAYATLLDSQGRETGKATLTQTGAGVLVVLEARGLPPGEHAVHFHTKGTCDPGTKYESAGAHYAPRNHEHGFQASGGPHAGDMPNVFVAVDGTLKAHVLNPNVTLGAGSATLLDPDGTALVIHAKPDDYKSQPSGNAGDRIACGVVKNATTARTESR